jgi:dephospho-CoA kinase
MKRQRPDKYILGITGVFGSGKTTVSRMFKGSGVRIIDADKIVHDRVLRDKRIKKKIIELFGLNVSKSGGGELDRGKISGIVFNNKESLRKLNLIIHPEVIRIIKYEIKNSRERIIILDVPLLIESGLFKMADKIIVVSAGLKNIIHRLRRKRRILKEDVLKRRRYQLSLNRKIRMADFVIDNDGTKENTKEQVEKIRRLLWGS